MQIGKIYKMQIKYNSTAMHKIKMKSFTKL